MYLQVSMSFLHAGPEPSYVNGSNLWLSYIVLSAEQTGGLFWVTGAGTGPSFRPFYRDWC